MKTGLILGFILLVSLTVNAQTDSVFTNLEDAIKAGENVKVLILKKQKLTEIPAEIFLLKNLHTLDLRKNKITDKT